MQYWSHVRKREDSSEGFSAMKFPKERERMERDNNILHAISIMYYIILFAGGIIMMRVCLGEA